MRMAAFTVLEACALAAGAEFAAVSVFPLGYALPIFNFALALRVCTLFRHEPVLLYWILLWDRQLSCH